MQELLQVRAVTGVVIVQQQGVELFHVSVCDGEDAGTGGDEDSVCEGHAGALVSIPEELPSCTPRKSFQGFFRGGHLRAIDKGEKGFFDLFIDRNRRDILRAGDPNGAGAQHAPFQRFIPCDKLVELAQIGQRDRLIDGLDQIPPCVTHM